MNIVIRITNLDIRQPHNEPHDEEQLRKMIVDRVSEAFNNRPLTNLAWIARYTVEEVSADVTPEHEVGALALMVQMFKRIDRAGRNRILAYLNNRFGG